MSEEREDGERGEREGEGTQYSVFPELCLYTAVYISRIRMVGSVGFVPREYPETIELI